MGSNSFYRLCFIVGLLVVGQGNIFCRNRESTVNISLLLEIVLIYHRATLFRPVWCSPPSRTDSFDLIPHYSQPRQHQP